MRGLEIIILHAKPGFSNMCSILWALMKNLENILGRAFLGFATI